MNKRAVVVGGFTTSKWAMEPLGHAIVDANLATDVDTFTFPYAMKNPDMIRRAAKDQLLLTHSAGIVAVSNANGMRPEQLVAYNGPEPRTKLELVGAASRKLIEHAKAAVAGPHRANYARVIASNTIEGTLHGYGNVRHLSEISGFSTYGQLAVYQATNINIRAVVTDGDIFFPHDASRVPEGMNVYLYPGGHDELLVNPAPLLADIPVRI